MLGRTTWSFLFALLLVSLSYDGVAAGLVDGLLSTVNQVLDATLGISLGGGALINVNLNAGVLSNSACSAQNKIIGTSIAVLGLLRVCACVGLGTGDYNSAGTAVYSTGLLGIQTKTATQYSCGTCPANAQPVCVTQSGNGLNAAGGCACACNAGFYADATLGICVPIATCVAPRGTLTYQTASNAQATCTCAAPYSRNAATGQCTACAAGYTLATDGTCKPLTASAQARMKRRLAEEAAGHGDPLTAGAALPAHAHNQAGNKAHHQNVARAAKVGAGQVHKPANPNAPANPADAVGTDADAFPQVSFEPKARLGKRGALCPGSETACPLRSGGFECVDTTSDLASCGGCVGPNGTGTGENCLAIPGALKVECFQSKCQVASCFSGWHFDGQRCQKTKTKGKARSKSRRRHDGDF